MFFFSESFLENSRATTEEAKKLWMKEIKRIANEWIKNNINEMKGRILCIFYNPTKGSKADEQLDDSANLNPLKKFVDKSYNHVL